MPILGLKYVYFIYRASPLQAKKVKLACLKGLAHEIDIKNFDKSFQNSLRKGRGCFLNLLDAPNDFIMRKIYLLRLMPVSLA